MRRIARAVDVAEDETGLQLAVYVGPTSEDPRAQARAMLHELGHDLSPAVLILVAPERRHLEIVTSPAAQHRLTDRQAALVAASMAASFAVGDYVGGICTGVAMIAQYAGPPPDDWQPEREMPDVLSGYAAARPDAERTAPAGS
jgi:uncharacterized membrane protein YgcG